MVPQILTWISCLDIALQLLDSLSSFIINYLLLNHLVVLVQFVPPPMEAPHP